MYINVNKDKSIVFILSSKQAVYLHSSTRIIEGFTRLITDSYWRIFLLSVGVSVEAVEVWIDSESLADMLKAKGLASQRRLSNGLYLNLLSN